MLDQDRSQYETQDASDRQNVQVPAGTGIGLDRQVRETVEALKLKVENLRLFLSWRK
jgi:hypothetical protein